MTPRQLARRLRDAVTSPWGSLIRVQVDAPIFAMTFDDGPDPDATPRVLDALDAHGGRATFFMLVNRARAHPDLVAEVRRRGHEVALHGLTHRRLTDGPSAAAVRDIGHGRAELAEIAGAPIRGFRPPYGAQNLPIWRAARRSGLEVVFWGPTLWDWKDAAPDDRLRRAMAGAGPGAIVLAHDGLAGAANGAEPTPIPDLDRPAWTGEILGRYAGLGLRSVPVSELLGTGRPVRAARFVR